MYELITEIKSTNQNARNALSEVENLIIAIKIHLQHFNLVHWRKEQFLTKG